MRIAHDKIMSFLEQSDQVERDYSCWIETDIFSVSSQANATMEGHHSLIYAANADSGWHYWARERKRAMRANTVAHWSQYLHSSDMKTRARLGTINPDVREESRRVMIMGAKENGDLHNRFLHLYCPPTKWCLLDLPAISRGTSSSSSFYTALLNEEKFVSAKVDEKSGNLEALWEFKGDPVTVRVAIVFGKEHSMPLRTTYYMLHGEESKIFNVAEMEWKKIEDTWLPSSIKMVYENCNAESHTEVGHSLSWKVGKESPDEDPNKAGVDWRGRFCRLFEMNCPGL